MVANDSREFVKIVHNKLPETWIYVMSIKPSYLRWNEWPKMKVANVDPGFRPDTIVWYTSMWQVPCSKDKISLHAISSWRTACLLSSSDLATRRMLP